jgi:DNA gyrase/topoisomerase IV subunit B
MARISSYSDPLSIPILTGVEAVRKRPGMYIGGLDSFGMHNMLWELVENSINEHLRAGTAGYVRITFDGDHAIVEDDGRGIAVEQAIDDGRALIELIMTELGGARLVGPAPRPGPTMHGVGAAAVSALSSELEVEVWRNGRVYEQHFSRGKVLGPLEARGATTRTGTRVGFTPDFTMFERHAWDVAAVARRCRELAAITPRLTFIVEDEVVCYPDGLLDHVRLLTRGRRVVEPVHVRTNERVKTEYGDVTDVGVEAAIAWVDSDATELHGFVNQWPCPSGPHVEGMLAGLRTALGRRIAKRRKVPPAVERGMVALLRVMLDDPRFGSFNRTRLQNEEAGDAVRNAVIAGFTAHAAANPAALDALLIHLEA